MKKCLRTLRSIVGSVHEWFPRLKDYGCYLFNSVDMTFSDERSHDCHQNY